MSSSPKEITLELTPENRLDVIDVSQPLEEAHGDLRSDYRKTAYCSYHTTAGYLEQSLCARMNHDPEAVQAFVRSFQNIFPPDADYRHDQMELRSELSEAQKKIEPLNGDSHLIYIGSGLENCVTYRNDPQTPVFFIDLDGVNRDVPRRRHTTVIGFNEEMPVLSTELEVPVSRHQVDSVNLMDPRLELFDQLHELLNKHGVGKGRIDIALDPQDRYAGLTVNEYETLLMQHDLAEVLRNPVRFMAQKGRNMLMDPRSVPSKMKNYAKYDLVRFVNEAIDALGMSDSIVERIIDKFIAASASRRLRMKRSVSLLVNNTDAQGRGSIIQGTYQSPILVQWRRHEPDTRRLKVAISRFE